MTDNREDATHEGRPDRKKDDDLESHREKSREAKDGKRDIGESDRGVERSDWNYPGETEGAE